MCARTDDTEENTAVRESTCLPSREMDISTMLLMVPDHTVTKTRTLLAALFLNALLIIITRFRVVASIRPTAKYCASSVSAALTGFALLYQRPPCADHCPASPPPPCIPSTFGQHWPQLHLRLLLSSSKSSDADTVFPPIMTRKTANKGYHIADRRAD